MPNVLVLEQAGLAELTPSVDEGRVAAAPFKLRAAFRTLLNTRLADLMAKDAATRLTEGDRATANVRTALDQLTVLLRNGHNFVNGIGSFSITQADRLGVFTAFGWESRLIGEFTDARVEALANQAITRTPSIQNPAHAYPAALLTRNTTQLAIVNANQPIATGGTAQAAKAALDLLQTTNNRVRFWDCSPTDDETLNPGTGQDRPPTAPSLRRRSIATTPVRDRHRDLRCRSVDLNPPRSARSRDEHSRLPQTRRRSGPTRWNVDDQRRLGRRRRPTDSRRPLRILVRRPQLARRRAAEQSCFVHGSIAADGSPVFERDFGMLLLPRNTGHDD